MKIVKKRLADGTIKTYEYDSARYGNGRLLGSLDRQSKAAAKIALAASGLPPAPPILIYFIQSASGPIKIGITDNLARRFQSIARSAFEDVRVLATFFGSRELERRLHNSLARHRLKNDWFAPHEHVLRAISDVRNEVRRGAPLRKLKWKLKGYTSQIIAA